MQLSTQTHATSLARSCSPACLPAVPLPAPLPADPQVHWMNLQVRSRADCLPARALPCRHAPQPQPSHQHPTPTPCCCVYTHTRHPHDILPLLPSQDVDTVHQKYDAKVWLLLQWYRKGEPPGRDAQDNEWKPDLEWQVSVAAEGFAFWCVLCAVGGAQTLALAAPPHLLAPALALCAGAGMLCLRLLLASLAASADPLTSPPPSNLLSPLLSSLQNRT